MSAEGSERPQSCRDGDTELLSAGCGDELGARLLPGKRRACGCPRGRPAQLPMSGLTADVTDPSQKALLCEAAPLRSAFTRPASRVQFPVSGINSSKMSRNCKTDT